MFSGAFRAIDGSRIFSTMLFSFCGGAYTICRSLALSLWWITLYNTIVKATQTFYKQTQLVSSLLLWMVIILLELLHGFFGDIDFRYCFLHRLDFQYFWLCLFLKVQSSSFFLMFCMSFWQIGTLFSFSVQQNSLIKSLRDFLHKRAHKFHLKNPIWFSEARYYFVAWAGPDLTMQFKMSPNSNTASASLELRAGWWLCHF